MLLKREFGAELTKISQWTSVDSTLPCKIRPTNLHNTSSLFTRKVLWVNRLSTGRVAAKTRTQSMPTLLGRTVQSSCCSLISPVIPGSLLVISLTKQKKLPCIGYGRNIKPIMGSSECETPRQGLNMCMCVWIRRNHLTFPLWLQPPPAAAEGKDREPGNEWRTPDPSSWGEKQKERKHERRL